MIEQVKRPETYCESPRETSAPHDLLQIDDVLRFAGFTWRHKWRIGVGLVLAVLLGGLYLATATPMYQSEAQLLIEKNGSLELDGMDARVALYRDNASAHLAILKSPWFINRVFEQQSLRLMCGLSECKDPIKTIISSLTVTHENREEDAHGDSIVLKLVFQGPTAEECPVVLNAIVESYTSLLHESRKNQNEDALKLVTQKSEQVQQRLQQLDADYRAFRHKAPVVLNRDLGSTVTESRLSDLEARWSAVRVRRAELERRLDAIKIAAQQRGDHSVALALVPDAFKRDAYVMLEGRYKALEETLLPLLVQEKTHLRTLGPGHRLVKDVREQIRLTRALLTPTGGEEKHVLTHVDANYDIRWVDPVKSYIQSLKLELGDNATSEQTLAKQIAEAKAEARELANYEFEDRRYAGDIARTQLYYEGLTKQLQGIDLSKDSGGYNTSILASAGPVAQVAPNVLLVLAFSVFFGLALGFGWAVLAEARNQAFRGAGEISQHLRLPVLGQIPVLKPANGKLLRRGTATNGAVLDPVLCTHFQPGSTDAEAFRGIRTALYHNTRAQKDKIIQIASPSVDDGKSTLAANLAVSMAQSGKRVLLVDADLRCPQLHEMFGLSAETGLSSLLCDEVELSEAIQPGGLTGLSVLPAGPIPPNPADLLASPRLQELLDAVRDQFDYVLIDTSALLAVTDPQIVAPSADGVLLTIRPSKKGRPNAARACEMLRMLGANLIGVVENGTRTDAYQDYGYQYRSAGVSNGQSPDHSRQDTSVLDHTVMDHAEPDHAVPEHAMSESTNGNGASQS